MPEPLRVAVVGSVNIDDVYTVRDFPRPGETISATHRARNLGGKGANQAVAVSKADTHTVLIGCVGDDEAGQWARATLVDHGVDVTHLGRATSTATGNAIVAVDHHGENSIIVHPAANHHVDSHRVAAALHQIEPAIVLTQLETPTKVTEAIGRSNVPLKIVNVAPFTNDALAALADFDIIIANENEHADLITATQHSESKPNASTATLIVTRGANGIDIHQHGSITHIPAVPPAQVVDTTGAGDTFCGFLTARLAAGDTIVDATRVAAAAASIAITRPGASSSIPTLPETKTIR